MNEVLVHAEITGFTFETGGTTGAALVHNAVMS